MSGSGLPTGFEFLAPHGGGNGDENAQRQAAEEARRQKARSEINALFGYAPDGTEATGETASNHAARDALYQKVRDDYFGAGRRQIDEQRDDAKRRLKFALFDSGQAGGSGQVDQDSLLDRKYNQALLDLGGKADATRTGLMTNDEQSRLNLLGQVDSGIDQGTALSSALSQMSSNADQAAHAAQGQMIGDLFGDAGFAFNRQQQQAGRRASRNDYNQSSGNSYGGVVTTTG